MDDLQVTNNFTIVIVDFGYGSVDGNLQLALIRAGLSHNINAATTPAPLNAQRILNYF